MDYYVPRSAREARALLRKYWTEKEIPLPKGFSHMKKNQLYAIYHNIRRRCDKTSPQTKEIAKEPKKPREEQGRLEQAVQLTLFS